MDDVMFMMWQNPVLAILMSHRKQTGVVISGPNWCGNSYANLMLRAMSKQAEEKLLSCQS